MFASSSCVLRARFALATVTLCAQLCSGAAVVADPLSTPSAAAPPPQPVAPSPEPKPVACDRQSIGTVTVAGSLVGGVVTLFGYNVYSQDMDAALLPLGDVAAFLHAQASTTGDRGRLTVGGKTLDFDLHSRAVWVDGVPVSEVATAPYVKGTTLYVSGDIAARFLGSEAYGVGITQYVPLQANLQPLPVPVECRPLHVTAVQNAIVAAAQLPFPRRAKPGPFCDGLEPFDIYTVLGYGTDLRKAREDTVKPRADAELCNGNYAAAARAYASISVGFEADVGGGIDKPEFERRFHVAEELAGTGSPGTPRLLPESRAFVNGDVCRAMRGYAADEGNYPRSGDEYDAYQQRGPSPELKLAAGAACSGDLVAARAHMAKVKGDALGLYDLMIGALYARQHDWYDAASLWWAAAGAYPDVATMESIEISQYQLEALALIDYYRAHIRYV